MQNVLTELYYGEIRPYEDFLPSYEQYKEQWKHLHKHYDGFVEKLPPSLFEEFNKVMEENIADVNLDMQEMFTEGFCLGVKMMIEIFTRGK